MTATPKRRRGHGDPAPYQRKSDGRHGAGYRPNRKRGGRRDGDREREAMTIAEFLLARIAEDEEMAGAEIKAGARRWDDGPLIGCAGRVLADCKAKRAMIEASGAEWQPTQTSGWVLGWFARAYSDHTDFDPDWLGML